SLFLARTFIAENPGYFTSMVSDGSRIENHTLSHRLDFARTSYAEQKAEICGMSDYELAAYGRRPVLFRPPGGPYSPATRRAAADCGIRAIVDWAATVDNGRMHYQSGDSLKQGDIVLMHFRPGFMADLAAFVAAQRAAGLRVALLENFLGLG
ncbi:MAG TPA: polysaccharide deacetylase family protein, partial [Micrococcaceae bacterium]